MNSWRKKAYTGNQHWLRWLKMHGCSVADEIQTLSSDQARKGLPHQWISILFIRQRGITGEFSCRGYISFLGAKIKLWVLNEDWLVGRGENSVAECGSSDEREWRPGILDMGHIKAMNILLENLLFMELAEFKFWGKQLNFPGKCIFPSSHTNIAVGLTLHRLMLSDGPTSLRVLSNHWIP